MATLDNVIELQAQGVSEQEIAKRLMDQGVQPKEINDALNQAKIKQAVQQEDPSQFSGMEQSLMPTEEEQAIQQEQQPAQEYAPQQQYQQPGYDYQYPASMDTETITEIANQVVSEKFSEFKQKTGDIVSFKSETQDKLKDLNERLRKIETTLDSIQRAILGKVGEFGENMNYVRKDLDNLHNTVSGLMNPLIDNFRELKKLSERK